jgi:hypothetical protein
VNVEEQEQAIDAQFAIGSIIHRTDLLDQDDAREDEFRARWEPTDAG